MAKSSLYDKTDKKLQKISGTIGAVIVIAGAVTGCVSWLNNQLKVAISTQVSALQAEIQEADKSQNQAITRLELTNLIQNDPTNTAAIEKMARYYFHDLDGDLYMTQKFSEWCRKYDGDATIIIGDHK